MRQSLKQRIANLENSPAFTLEAFLESLTDDELQAIVGDDCRGVPWSEFTDEEIEALASGDDSPIETARARYNKRK